ncbi:MAG: dihydroxyacetone kinase subunit DhaK, partial [Pseudomonadota bacterium]
MKKILNDPEAYVDEMLDGLCAAHPQFYRLVGDDKRAVARATPGAKGKVGIVSGGGSGHLPVFTGYVGPGLLDACAIGDVFNSPTTDQMADAIRAADQGAGVLRLYGNYGGDVMNFDMAGDMVEMDDIACTTVLLADDVASAPPEEAEKRRGVAGMVYAFKMAGAAAEAGLDLDGVTRVAQKAADACRSVGAALSSCTVPQAGKPTFHIAEDEMEMGMGIHGEPGVWRDKLKPADEIAEEMMDRLLADMPVGSG